MTDPAVRVALASGNPGKLREIAEIMAPAGVEVVPPEASWRAPEETADTYIENALLKARSLAEHARMPALADDSGIEVDALDGGPGVRSARYAGPGASDGERVAKLLEEIRDVAEHERGARFRCVAVLVVPGGVECSAEGVVEGRIAIAPRGSGGFGYDPVFFPEGLRRTMAELSPAEKHRLSHRGRAFRGLLPAVRGLAR